MAPPPDYSELYATCLRHSASHPACDQLFACLRPIFRGVASRVARQYDASPEVDDILQEINLKLVADAATLLPALPREPESAEAYFRVLAANAARDYFRMRNSAKRGRGRTTFLQHDLEWLAADTGSLGELELRMLFDRIEENLAGSPRERYVFRLYYRQGYSAREIAGIPAVELKEKGVVSLLNRMAGQIRTRLADPRATKGKQTGDSFHS